MSMALLGRHYMPIDAAAKDGSGQCVRDSDGRLHSARWRDGAWRYSSNVPVNKEITHYVRSNR